MRIATFGLTLAAALAGFLAADGDAAVPPAKLKPASAFADIKDKNARSVALFTEAGKVLMHPRCLNCHPAGDSPTQGMDMHPHQPSVVRGDGGLGAAGMHCGTCHGQANFEPARVPGNPAWALAPIEMAWQHKTLGEICMQIKDPKRNGNRNLNALVQHMAEDSLVGWAWKPGGGREPAPGSQKAFGNLIRAWVKTGAACPAG
jgi:mono/diheme cytochrome c family protein